MQKPRPTIERIKEMFSYNPATGQITRRGHEPYKPTPSGYVYVSCDGWVGLAHRVIWAVVYGRWPNEVDHIDNDPSNNRLSNLREVSSQQNNFNRSMSRRNKTGVKGVQWEKSRRRWRAIILREGKQHVQRFRTLDEAAAAIRQMRDNLHGEFANHGNDPD